MTEAATLVGALEAPSGGDVTAIWWQLIHVVVVGALIAVLAWNEAVTVAALVGANLVSRQATLRPVSAAWAATRSAKPAKSRA